jgi:hypothetical protein
MNLIAKIKLCVIGFYIVNLKLYNLFIFFFFLYKYLCNYKQNLNRKISIFYLNLYYNINIGLREEDISRGK